MMAYFALLFLLLWLWSTALLVRAWRDKWDAEDLTVRLLCQIESHGFGGRA